MPRGRPKRPEGASCPKCGTSAMAGTPRRCYECAKRTKKAWDLANPAKLVLYRQNRDKGKKRAHQRRLAGIPAPTRPCPATCENCGRLPGKKSLCVDHCHVTGKFRGWLCMLCNTGIGKLGDSVAGLERAIRYLKFS